jgi:hypothetical protein
MKKSHIEILLAATSLPNIDLEKVSDKFLMHVASVILSNDCGYYPTDCDTLKARLIVAKEAFFREKPAYKNDGGELKRLADWLAGCCGFVDVEHYYTEQAAIFRACGASERFCAGIESGKTSFYDCFASSLNLLFQKAAN